MAAHPRESGILEDSMRPDASQPGFILNMLAVVPQQGKAAQAQDCTQLHQQLAHGAVGCIY